MKRFSVDRVVNQPFSIGMDGPHTNAVYAIPSSALWEYLSTASLSAWNASPPRNVIQSRLTASILFRLYPLVNSGDAEGFVAAEPKQDCQRLTNKITTAWLLRTNAHCPMPNEINLFNQRDFLKEFLLHSNEGALAQDLVGHVIGYAVPVVHDKDIDSNIHKTAAALGKRPASELSRPVLNSLVSFFECDVQREIL